MFIARTAAADARADGSAPAAELFENKVRPVLVDRCASCHSAKIGVLKGGLSVDTPEEILKGGASGPAIVPGDPDHSLLIRIFLGQAKDVKLSPEGHDALPPAQVEAAAAWIKLGAPASAAIKPSGASLDSAEGLAKARTFWSLQPVKDSPPPKVNRADWVRTSIDAFVLAKLEEKGLTPSPQADKRSLIRRATYDLTGLPPTMTEVEAFVAGDSPQAFERIVDRLLASPHYGEHWGRHWLDVARYGDTRWVGAAEDRRLPFAYTYRDWVIGALNQDLPYDRFVTLQLAADQVPADQRSNSDLAALGFLTVGKWFTGNIHDVIDDQIDVVTRGLLGLTVQCARCHDHKFDPILTKDYYSLYGLFAASRMPVEGTGMLATLPDVGAPPVDTAVEQELTALRTKIDAILQDRQAGVRQEFSQPGRIVEYMLLAQPLIEKSDDEVRTFIKARSLNENVFFRWVRLLKRTSKDPGSIFAPWHAFAGLSEQEFTVKADDVAEREHAKQPNKLAKTLAVPAPKSQAELAERYAQFLLSFDKPEPFPEQDEESIREIFRGGDSPVQLPINELASNFTKAEIEEVQSMRRALLQKLSTLSADADQYVMFRRELAPLLDDENEFLTRRKKEIAVELRQPEKIADYLLGANEGRGADDVRLWSIAKSRKLSEAMLRRWIDQLDRAAQRDDAVFSAWREFTAVSDAEFAARSEAVTNTVKGAARNRTVTTAFDAPPASLKDVASRYASLIAKFGEEQRLQNPDEEAIRQVSMLTHVGAAELEDYFGQKDKDELKNRETKILRLFNDHPGTSPHAMVVKETARGYAQRVFLRGNPNTPGPDATGGFLTVLCGPADKPFTKGRGRADLARAIVDPANPLTARVMVNRVWVSHFGKGIVGSPSDFGIRGDSPTHPELLDWLARQFVTDGWSLKKLHRNIMLSATYRQSTQDVPAARQVDVENHLYWRMNRRRLAFEEVRDSVLCASGQLDETMGGRPVDLVKSDARRRTVYGAIDRISLPGFYRYFDFPGADAHVPERLETIVPQQALFMMNNAFVMDQAYRLSHRQEVLAETSPEGFVAALYRLVYQRPPTPEELELGAKFINSAPPPPASAAVEPTTPWRYGYGRYDDKLNRIATFEPFPYFGNGSWRGGAQDPDPLLGRCTLNGGGGTASNERGRAVIRRWIAPIDGKISITGMLDVGVSLSPNGDGVRGRIVSSRLGQLGVWIVHGTQEPTILPSIDVHRGDTIDFIVEGRGQEQATGFSWAPVVHAGEAPAAPPASNAPLGQVWDAQKDFGESPAGKRTYGIRERFAQVLLESNEFLFLD